VRVIDSSALVKGFLRAGTGEGQTGNGGRLLKLDLSVNNVALKWNRRWCRVPFSQFEEKLF
jgi:hypothetical protein